ncbi:MAG: hypothetical protein ACLTLW_07555 [Sutterella wadsworthensis]
MTGGRRCSTEERFFAAAPMAAALPASPSWRPTAGFADILAGAPTPRRDYIRRHYQEGGWDGSHWNYGGRRYTAAEYGRYWSKHYEERREPKKPSGPAKPPQHPQQKPGPQAGRNPPKGPGHDNGRHEGRKNDERRDNWDGPR